MTRRALCPVCGRRIALQLGTLRPHKVVGITSAYPRKAERDAARAAAWCPGGARQLPLL